MLLKPMYKGKAFSPLTTLKDSIGAGDTVIEVNDISVFPPAPNYATIGTDDNNAETVKYAAMTESALSGCVRGVEGVARAWNIDTPISTNLTATLVGDIIDNIEDLNENKADLAALKHFRVERGGIITNYVNYGYIKDDDETLVFFDEFASVEDETLVLI